MLIIQQIEKEFKQKKDKVHQKKRNLDKKIAKERAESLDFINKSTERYYRSEISLETHNANIDAREKSMDERANREKDNEKTKTDSISAVATEKKGRITKLQEKYKNVRWVCTSVRGRAPSLTSESFNEAWGKGDIRNSFNFREFMVGGGFAYLEPFFQGDTPQGKTPYGLLISAKGTATILAADWRDGEGNIISENIRVAFGSTVYLNIYTQALYGREIEIALKDKGNWLSRTFNMNKKLTANQKAEGAGDAEELEIQAEKFIRGVAMHNAPQNPPEVEIGKIVESGENIHDGKWKEVNTVQMCQFPVKIDHMWSATAGDDLGVYPTVFYEKLEQEFLECKLMVHKNYSRFYEVEKIESNQVAIYSNIETNIAHFNPCGYTKIISQYGLEENEVTIFEQKSSTNTKELKLQLIADDKPVDWSIRLENQDSQECRHNGTEKAHTGKVISLSPGTSLDMPIITDDLLNDTIFYPKPSLEQAVEMAWLPNIEPLKYGVDFASCRFQQHLDVEVYPDLEYELGFKLKMENPFYTGQTKAYTNRKYLGNGGFFDRETNKEIRKAQRQQRKENYKNEKQEVKEGRLNFDSFEIAAEYSFGGVKQAEISIDGEHPFFNVMNTIMWIGNMVSNLSFSREADESERELDSNTETSGELRRRRRNHNKYLKKAKKALNKIPLKIDIEGPVFAGAVAWGFSPSTKQPGKIGTNYAVKFKADPLISVEGRLDLLFVASKIPYVGAVVKGLTSVADTAGYADDFWNSLVDFFGGGDKHKIKLDVDYYIDLYCKGSLNIEATATEYHTLDSFRKNDIACNATIGFGVDCGGSIKSDIGDAYSFEAEFKANAEAIWEIKKEDGKIKCKYQGLYVAIKTNIKSSSSNIRDMRNNGETNNTEPKKFLLHDGFSYEFKID